MIKDLVKNWLVAVRCLKGRLNGADIKSGKNNYIASGVFFSAGRVYDLGSENYIGRNVSLSCHLTLERKIMIASNVAFVGGDHIVDKVNGYMMDAGRDEIKKITVEEDVWIGHGAVILHGVKLERGCVIGAGSVVTKDVGKYTIVAGNPARFIRRRLSSS